MSRTVHVVGAGLAGLAAALRLSRGGRRVVVHEASP
ncbi:FAD-binding protein, partial [Roseomonas sp. NAR14]